MEEESIDGFRCWDIDMGGDWVEVGEGNMWEWWNGSVMRMKQIERRDGDGEEKM